MTKEERTVVQAAIAAAEVGSPMPDFLYKAVQNLFVNCRECNMGGHQCPGDGNPIPHGDIDCGQHDEQQEHDELIWVPRTWADVREGDMVRLPGQDAPPAYVASAKHRAWHVDPRSSEYRPQPMEWSAIFVTLADRPPTLGGEEQYPIRPLGSWDMDPAKPVEIQVTRNEAAALDAAGWMNRATIIVEPKLPS